MRPQRLTAMLALGSLAIAACNEDTTAPSAAPASPSAEIQAAAANSWTIRTDMLTTRTNVAVATVKNAAGQSIVYAIGGRNPNGVPLKTVSAYNVATNTWTFRRALPVALAWTNGAAVINGKIYVSGGFSDYLAEHLSNALYMYDPATNTWTRKHDMPSVSGPYDDPLYVGAQGVTGVINGQLYVITTCYTSDAPWPDMPESSCYENGKLVGPAFFRYNPVSDRWLALSSPSSAFADTTMLSPFVGGVTGGKFYVFGTSWFDQISGRLAAYDPATNRWTRKNALGLARPGAAAAALGGRLYVIGGTRHNAGILDKTIAYDPATNRWTTRAPMPSARTDIAATVVQVNGQSRIEVIGGPAPGNNLQYIP
jgi:hypothetical protein